MPCHPYTRLRATKTLNPSTSLPKGERRPIGLWKAGNVDLLEISWPSGQVGTLRDLPANQLVIVKEGEGILRSEKFPFKKPG